MKVLITGVNGFTGSHLFSYLIEKGFSVYGMAHNGVYPLGENRYECDLLDGAKVGAMLQKIQPDFVIHLAGIANVAHSREQDFYRVNTVGSENLLKACLELKKSPKKIVVASSSNVYGNQQQFYITENATPNPINHYAMSKWAMEQMVTWYQKRLNILIVRPFNYTGEGQSEHFLIPKIIRHYAEGKPEIELGNCEIVREFNDIDFVCEIYYRLLTQSHHANLLNICSGRAVTLKQVMELMDQIAGYEIKVVVSPKFIRDNDIVRLVGSPEKCFHEVGKIEQRSMKELLSHMFLCCSEHVF